MRALGITGSRFGPTPTQSAKLTRVLLNAKFLGYEVLHHGDCIGVDKMADVIAKTYSYKTICHPPNRPNLRAFTTGHLQVKAQLPYLVRNRAIVNASEFLIAVPSGPEEIRSGTWATIRFARMNHVPVMIIHPDGNITIEDNHE